MKTIFDARSELNTIENYLVVIRNALAGQGPEVGAVGPTAWVDIFSDLCDRLEDCNETLTAIERSKRA